MPKFSTKSFKGKWKITKMDQWDVEPGWFIEFDGKGYGSLHFMYIDAEIDHRMSNDSSNNDKRSEFTFYGSAEYDEIFGRGWVEINGTYLHGYLYFHQGDESGFKGKLQKPRSGKTKK